MKQNFENCFQCVAYCKCFPGPERMELENARQKAAACQKPFRGLGTDLAKIVNTTKCISLKKAYKYSLQGRVEWVEYHLVQFLDSKPGIGAGK